MRWDFCRCGSVRGNVGVTKKVPFLILQRLKSSPVWIIYRKYSTCGYVYVSVCECVCMCVCIFVWVHICVYKCRIIIVGNNRLYCQNDIDNNGYPTWYYIIMAIIIIIKSCCEDWKQENISELHNKLLINYYIMHDNYKCSN